MLNLKICGTVTGTAFVFSLLIGLVNGSSMPMLVIRPFIFAALFFLIAAFAFFLVNHFLPELLEKDNPGGDIPLPGSRIDITESDTPAPSFQAVLGAQADDSDEGLGDISDLMNGNSSGARASAGRTQAGMDQNPQDEYNDRKDLGDFSEPDLSFPEPESLSGGGSPGAETYQSGGTPAAAVAAADFSDSVDILPDLDSIAGAFLPASGAAESDTAEFSVSAPAPKRSAGGKTQAWSGDFNAKDLAMGLRTILSKDKEG